MRSRPALLKRLPRLRWRPGPPQNIVDPAELAAYPEIAADVAVLDRELMPAFRRVDNHALHDQNTFYLVQFAFSLGAVLATALGAVHAALGGGVLAIGLLETTISGALGAGALRAYSQGAQRSYYTKRLQAERLRGEYFLFLGRIGPYARAADPHIVLRQRVEELTA